MSHLSELLQSGNFVVTAEINPPKGVDMTDTLSRADVLSGLVDAVNLTDHPGSHMSVSPLALAPLIRERGLEAILQVTCRDRNRIAIQGDLLAAHVLGVENVLCLTGDPVGAGDHPEAKTVFDLDSIRLLEAATSLNGGTDMGSNRLRGAPSFYLGAAVNPFASELADEIIRMEEKITAGAQFFQSQAVFDTTQLAEFMAIVKPLGAPVIAGVILLKSGEMARNMNQNIPGVLVPDHLIAELDGAHDKAQAGIQIAARIIREARDICDGVHIMAIGWERYIPQVLDMSGTPARERVQ